MKCTLYARDYGQQGLKNIHIQTLLSGNSHCVESEQSEVNKAIYLFLPEEFYILSIPSKQPSSAQRSEEYGI